MLFFDEAGNSGDNLLDNDQPSYLLLSHNFTEEESRLILDPLLKKSKADELHFKKINKYFSQQQLLIECMQNDLIGEGRAHFYVAHKPFMVAVQLVDKLIEPVLYDIGIDIYQYGENLSTANILYILGNHYWNKELYKRMCELFVKWTRTASDSDCEQFYLSVSELYETLEHKRDKELLNLILLSSHQKDHIADSFEKYGTDPTLSCLVEHCHYWSRYYKEPFDVVCDNSKQIEHWRTMIDFLNNLPSKEVGFGSKKHRYPLQIKNLTTYDSESNIQLQLADIMASYINFYYTCRVKDIESPFGNAIAKTQLVHIIGNSMWPSTAITPEELRMEDGSGSNPLDFLAEQALKKPEEYAKVIRKKRK